MSLISFGGTQITTPINWPTDYTYDKSPWIWPPENNKPILFYKNEYKGEEFVGIVYGPHGTQKCVVIVIKHPKTFTFDPYADNLKREGTNTAIEQAERNSGGFPVTVITSNDIGSYIGISNEDFVKICRGIIAADYTTSEAKTRYRNKISYLQGLISHYGSIPTSAQTPAPSVFRDKDSITDKPSNCTGTNNLNMDYYLTDTGDPNMNTLFNDSLSDIILSDNKDKYPKIVLNERVRKKILKQLLEKRKIPDEEIKLIVNNKVSLENPIDNEKDELEEGKKITDYLSDTFCPRNSQGVLKPKNEEEKDLITLTGCNKDIGLKIRVGPIGLNKKMMKSMDGYVYIHRNGIKSYDVLTPNLFKPEEQLDRYKHMLGKPIDYLILKDAIHLNDFQRGLIKDLKQYEEARNILKQDYQLAFQPEPQYVMWFVTTLIKFWYCDPTLNNLIRKMKVLINLYRARGDLEYNKRNGILPTIVIYTKYGFACHKKVLDILIGHFSFYNHTGWKCSHPTYFRKYNDLIYYTNGDISLKEYYNKVKAASNNSIKSVPFNSKNTMIRGSEQVIETYEDKKEKLSELL